MDINALSDFKNDTRWWEVNMSWDLVAKILLFDALSGAILCPFLVGKPRDRFWAAMQVIGGLLYGAFAAHTLGWV